MSWDEKTQPDSKRSNIDERVYCEQQFNTHKGTCDSCGSLTEVSKFNIRGFEYLCDISCKVFAMVERKEIKNENTTCAIISNLRQPGIGLDIYTKLNIDNEGRQND